MKEYRPDAGDIRGRGGQQGRPAVLKLGEKEDRLVDEFVLVAFVSGENGVHLGSGQERVGFSVRLGFSASTGAGAAPSRFAVKFFFHNGRFVLYLRHLPKGRLMFSLRWQTKSRFLSLTLVSKS